MTNYSNIFIFVLCVLIVTFKDTPDAKLPAMVETGEVVDITDYSAMCRGHITDEGNGTIYRYGIELDD